MTVRRCIVVAAIGAAALAQLAHAQDSPSWVVRAGVHPIQPKERNHNTLRFDDGAALTFGVTYMLAPRWGVELFAALPTEHEIRTRDAGRVAEISQVPPTLSLQYHFLDPSSGADAYVGAGLNYTFFFDERTRGALSGARLDLDSSLGPAANIGLDVALGELWLVNVDARWFDIDSDARLNGANLGAVHLDPFAFGLSIGRRFQ